MRINSIGTNNFNFGSPWLKGAKANLAIEMEKMRAAGLEQQLPYCKELINKIDKKSIMHILTFHAGEQLDGRFSLTAYTASPKQYNMISKEGVLASQYARRRTFTKGDRGCKNLPVTLENLDTFVSEDTARAMNIQKSKRRK